MLMVVATWTPTLAQQPQKPGIEPIWLDFDMETIPEPKQVDTGYLYDFANNTLFQNVKQAVDIPRTLRAISGKPKPAYNVNSVDEVPDSSWFTNRMDAIGCRLKPSNAAQIRAPVQPMEN